MEFLAAFIQASASHPRAKRNCGGTSSAGLRSGRPSPAKATRSDRLSASCTIAALFTPFVALKKGERSGSDICKPRSGSKTPGLACTETETPAFLSQKLIYQSQPAEAMTISQPRSCKTRAEFAKLASNPVES